MIQKLKAKANGKRGFTLAELLIVIAIIGVLVAVAVPVFTSQLSNAEDAVKKANCRSVLSEATVDYLDGELTVKSYTYDKVVYTVEASGDVVTVTGGGYTCNTTNPEPTATKPETTTTPT